jgi:glutaredoxin
MASGAERIVVYGADWCGVTRQTLSFLDDLRVDYNYVDVEQDPEASQWVKDQNDGMEIKPTLKLGDRVLTAPGAEKLEEALRSQGTLS